MGIGAGLVPDRRRILENGDKNANIPDLNSGQSQGLPLHKNGEIVH